MKILFSTTKGNFISWAIRFLSWGDWSHVEIQIDRDQLLGADILGGVNVLSVDDRFGRSNKFLLCEFDIPEDKREDFIKLLKGELGKKYDIAGIFGHLFRTKWENSDKWFCSELIVAMATKIGYPILSIFDGRSNRITPRDLLLSNRLVRITEDAEEIKQLLRGSV